MGDVTCKINTELFGGIDDLCLGNAVAYNIEPLNEDKRIRVYEHQLLDTLLENSKSVSEFWFNLVFYEKTRNNLINRFPHREQEIKYINIGFLAKMQYIFKILTKRITPI